VLRVTAAASATSASATSASATSASATSASATSASATSALGALEVLGDPVRRRILERLARGPVCTCGDLVAVFDAKQPTISHHLKVLREAGLVTGERCGRFTYYGVVPDRVRELGQALVELADGATAPPSC
jgi:ArsR family transcriptional regulator, arsenate/arsenite/antimonite-responsive transcriptional repressor